MSERREPGAVTRRILPDTATAQERFDLLAQYAAGSEPLASLAAQLPAWEPLQDFLQRIVRDRSATLVYGDYDVDGTTSTFMLFRWLRQQGVPCNYFLPSRFKHGYGLDLGVIAQAKGQGYANLLALDCGTANLVEIASARAQGLQVAVIDHHTPVASAPAPVIEADPLARGPVPRQAMAPVPLLPDAVLFNPHTSPGLPPLCTAGLVYAVLRRMELLGGDPPAPDLPELAGLATLADVVPLEPHNWALAHRALLRLPETTNLGLDELVKTARLDGLTRLTARQAAFNLVPRLNAAGRMASAKLVVELFNAPDREVARSAVFRLEQLNTERKALTERIETQAVQQALALGLPAGLALYDADWHPGVLGIVAARVAERFGKPTVILGAAAQGGGLIAGSARAGKGSADVLTLLQAASSSLTSFGGHAQAAGLKLELGALAAFREGFAAAAGSAQAIATEGALEVVPPDVPTVALHDLTAELERDLWDLAPFGPAWPAPRCLVTGCEVLRASYMGSEKVHMNLLVTDGRVQVRIAGFNQSHLVHQLQPGQRITPLVEIEPDNWNNQLTIMLRLLALS